MKKIEVKVNGVNVALNVEFNDVKISSSDYYGIYSTETYRVWNDELGYEYNLEREFCEDGFEYDEHCYGDDAYGEDGELIISEEEQHELERRYNEAIECVLYENLAECFEMLGDDKVLEFLNTSYDFSSMRTKDHNDNYRWMINDLEDTLEIKKEDVGCAYSFNEDSVTEITMKGEHVRYESDGVEVFKFINKRVIKNYQRNDEWFIDDNGLLQNNYLFARGNKVVKVEERGNDLYVEYEDFNNKLNN